MTDYTWNRPSSTYQKPGQKTVYHVGDVMPKLDDKAVERLLERGDIKPVAADEEE